MTGNYENTINKEKVREIDLEVIQSFLGETTGGYIGLSSLEMLDIKLWSDYIDFVHTFEIDTENTFEMRKRIVQLGFYTNSKVIEGDIYEEINRFEGSFDAYSIINLDLQNTASTRKNSRLPFLELTEKILDELRENMRIHAKCVFITTLVAQWGMNQQLDKTLNRIKTTLIDNLQNTNVEEVYNYIESPEAKQGAKIATLFPIWFYEKSESFDVKCQKIIYYIGSGSTAMIHFVYTLEKLEDQAWNINTYWSLEKIKRIPLQEIIRVENGETNIDNLGIPEFRKNVEN